MRYTILDVDILEPLPAVELGPGSAGVAVLVRRRGIPVDFWMEEIAGPRTLRPEDVAKRIAAQAGQKLLAASIRDELGSEPAPARGPKVTVAVCTKDRPEGVARLLDSLELSRYACPALAHELELLVVDNAPSDERTRELCVERRSVVRYVREPKQGLNFARNRAVAEARGEFLAFVDDDVVVDRLWLDGFLAVWAAHPDAAAVTGQVLPLELETEAQILFERRGGFRRGFARVRYGPVVLGNSLYPGGVGIVGAGANMAFRVDALRELDGFDEALDTGAPMPGGGDLDIFYRVIRAGLPLVYEPRFLVFHQHRRELVALHRQYRRSWAFGFMVYMAKCLRTDPARRMDLIRLVGWWFSKKLWQLQKAVRGTYALPPSMVAGELVGGIVGLCGGYRRSQKRVERIRRRHA